MPPEGQGYQDPRFSFGHSGSDFTREVTDLSSIDLATEEDYEDPSRGFPVSEPPPRRGLNLPAAALALFAAVVACGSLAVLVPLAARPGGLQDPLLAAEGSSPGLVTARELLEGPELTSLAATRLQAAEPELAEVAGAEAVREEVALGFKDAAALASYRLDGLQMTLEQKEAVLRVLRDLTDEPRLHNTGLSVARALLAGNTAGAGTQLVLERLAPHMAEVRQLRDEVIPATLRLHAQSSSGHGQLTLDQRQFRFVETLSNRWNLEVHASLPQASNAAARRLAGSFGIDPQTGTFVEDMRTQAMDAKNALASTQADLASALQGLSAAAQGTSSDSADQQQIAKSTACTVITEAKNAMGTVRNSLTNMMARIAQVRGRVKDGKGKHLARTIFRNLQVDVAEINKTLGLREAEFSRMFADTQPNVYKTDSDSLILTKSTLMVVNSQVQDAQAQLDRALKEFKAMYNVYKGKGNVYNTVRMYASSAFYQLQETFDVPLPAIDNASAVLRDCLSQPNGMLGQLQCRLSYAQLCLELMLGMDATITVESTGVPTLAPLPGVGVSSGVISPITLTSTTTTSTATTQTTSTLNETEIGGFDLMKSTQHAFSSAGSWLAGTFDKFAG